VPPGCVHRVGDDDTGDLPGGPVQSGVDLGQGLRRVRAAERAVQTLSTQQSRRPSMPSRVSGEPALGAGV
jgi:hypothetical protein